MSIFKFEFKTLARQVITWSIALCLTFAVFSAMYPVYRDAQEQIGKVLLAFPKEFAAAFGIDISTIFSLNGFLAFFSMYLVLASSIMALYFGVAIFSREKRTKTSDFLLVKPISRSRVFLEKLGAGVVALVIVNTILMGFMQLTYAVMDTGGSDHSVYTLITFSLVVVQFVMFGLGVLLATAMRRVKSAAGVATSTGFALFIISMLYGVIDEQWLRYFSPSKYLDPGYIIINGRYESEWVLLSLAVLVVSIAYSYVVYVKQDLPSA